MGARRKGRGPEQGAPAGLLAAIGILAISLAACGPGQAPVPASAPQQAPGPERETAGPSPVPISLKIVWTSVSASFAPLWIAKEAGLFQKRGLEAEVLYIEGAPGFAAVVSGDIPLGMTSGPVVAAAQAAGSDLVLLGAQLNAFPYKIVAAPSIKTMGDLRGKVFGTSNPPSVSTFAAKTALRRAGLDPGTDVSLLNTGGETSRAAALQGGRTDAAILAPPGYLVLEKEGFNVLMDVGELGIEFPFNGPMTTRAFIKSNPEAVERFVAGIVEGIHFFKTRKEPTIEIMRKYLKSEDDDAMEETYRYYAKLFARVPYATPQAFRNLLEELSQQQPEVKNLDPEGLADNSFVRKLEESGFIRKLYGD